MNSKNTLFTLLAFASGVFTGYFVCKQKLEAQYQEDTQEYKDYISKKMGYVNEELEEEEGELTENYAQKSSIESQETYRKVVTNYQKPDISSLCHKEETVEVDEDDEDDMTEEEFEEMIAMEEEAEAERMATVDREEPYEINQYQFSEEPEYQHFDKVNLYYYRFDDTLCDDNDVKIEDEEDFIGWDFYKTLERQTLAHVRNEKIRTDYEIHALSRSYDEDVVGRVETDKEREYRRVARYKEAIDE